MEEIAQVYARSLFEVARERSVLDEVKQELDQFADALSENHDLAVFFFSPYFSTSEKKDGLSRLLEGADPSFINFLEALIERHRMPAIFRIRTRFDELWEHENRRCPSRLPARSSSTRRQSMTSASGSASRPGTRSTWRAASIRTFSGGSCCGSETRSSTPRSRTV